MRTQTLEDIAKLIGVDAETLAHRTFDRADPVPQARRFVFEHFEALGWKLERCEGQWVVRTPSRAWLVSEEKLSRDALLFLDRCRTCVGPKRARSLVRFAPASWHVRELVTALRAITHNTGALGFDAAAYKNSENWLP